jgi:hypothetical protein
MDHGDLIRIRNRPFESGIIPVPKGHYFKHYTFNSGSPAIDVSRDMMPARAAVEPTSAQSTPEITAVVPMAATAVWAMVLIARIPAARIHLFQYSLSIYLSSFSTDILCSNIKYALDQWTSTI